MFMYKYNQHLLPGMFLNMFNRNDDFHNYNTRQQFLLCEPIIKTELMRQTVRFTGVSLLNSLSSIYRCFIVEQFEFDLQVFHC